MHKNFKYVHGTKRWENPENTMTESVFATDKWRLRQSSLSQCDPLVTPPKGSLVLEVKTCEESSLTFTKLSRSLLRDRC